MTRGINISIRNILRTLSIIATVMFFCPNFLVSCAGQEIEISGYNLMTGIRKGGEVLEEPRFFFIIYLLIPIGMIFLLFIKKFGERLNALIMAICASTDIILWIILCWELKRNAEESMFDFGIKGWFAVNIITLATITALNVSVFLKKIEMDMSIIEAVSGTPVEGTVDRVRTSARKVAERAKALDEEPNAAGYCRKCGSPLEEDADYCTECGTPVEIQSRQQPKVPAQPQKRQNKPAQQQIQKPKATTENTKTADKCQFCGRQMEISKDGQYYLCHACRKKYRIVR